ncbi:HTH-type transcriptional repressor ComR [Novipirellula galeiformis]|uniref:HTH-type transcriptional repressor ComR n=1 Tax=Novipirellula galeiformis TaxID=2528004 RepID=A0A5C6CKI3_9BACT|nr:TetR/AcrR family transcriptional regulator [Novipirellula galeiformis]TWU23974.1 HTH-type transcriptional repressor ComR [Novipirellula galeiformis]
MPWEKSFDESDVIEQAMQVFWAKGYAATSISDITAATGIKRGSLYNAFDGKDDMFMRGLLKYDIDQRQKSIQELDALDDPREAILTFFDRIIQHSLHDEEKKGCLLVNTSLEYPQHNAEVQQVITEAFKQIAAFFERQIKRGQQRGDIPDAVQPRGTAKALVALLVGIRVMGRGTIGKAALQQIGEQAKRLIS